MSEKIKVGNAEVEKENYDYFSLMYEKMPKEYVVADLVSKCEDYDKLYKNYEMKDLQIEEIRKELINQDKYIGKLKEGYANQLHQKENIIKEVKGTLINSKEYKMAKEMDLTSGMSILIKIKDLLDKGE